VDGASAYQAKNWDETIRILVRCYQQAARVLWGSSAPLVVYGSVHGDGSIGWVMSKMRIHFQRAIAMPKRCASRRHRKSRQTRRRSMTRPIRLTTPYAHRAAQSTPLPAGTHRSSLDAAPDRHAEPVSVLAGQHTYLPNTFNGEGCRGRAWPDASTIARRAAGAAFLGRVRITGPSDIGGAAGRSNQLIGESGWMAQFDVKPKKIEGFIQVFYKDQPVSDVIPYETHKSCMENMLILDVQQVKPLP